MIPSPDDFAWTENELTNLWVPVWMTIQRLASELIRCSCKECGQANLIRSPFAEVEQLKFEWSGCMNIYISNSNIGGHRPQCLSPPPFLHLWYRGTMTQTLQIPWHQKKVWLKPYLPDLSLRHCFVTAIKHYQYIFADIAFELLSCRNI